MLLSAGSSIFSPVEDNPGPSIIHLRTYSKHFAYPTPKGIPNDFGFSFSIFCLKRKFLDPTSSIHLVCNLCTSPIFVSVLRVFVHATQNSYVADRQVSHEHLFWRHKLCHLWCTIQGPNKAQHMFLLLRLHQVQSEALGSVWQQLVHVPNRTAIFAKPTLSVKCVATQRHSYLSMGLLVYLTRQRQGLLSWMTLRTTCWTATTAQPCFACSNIRWESNCCCAAPDRQERGTSSHFVFTWKCLKQNIHLLFMFIRLP